MGQSSSKGSKKQNNIFLENIMKKRKINKLKNEVLLFEMEINSLQEEIQNSALCNKRIIIENTKLIKECKKEIEGRNSNIQLLKKSVQNKEEKETTKMCTSFL